MPRSRPKVLRAPRQRPYTPRPKSELAGPVRDVVYIFEREGEQGGALWWLVLECGHVVTRKRHEAKSWSAQVHLLFRPLSEKLAPKRVQCHYCGSGGAPSDPWVTIRAFGGPTE